MIDRFTPEELDQLQRSTADQGLGIVGEVDEDRRAAELA